jgi:hypothetical protein
MPEEFYRFRYINWEVVASKITFDMYSALSDGYSYEDTNTIMIHDNDCTMIVTHGNIRFEIFVNTAEYDSYIKVTSDNLTIKINDPTMLETPIDSYLGINHFHHLINDMYRISEKLYHDLTTNRKLDMVRDTFS